MSEESDKQTSLDSFDGSAPRRLNLPSQQPNLQPSSSSAPTRYHDMEKLYPNAPVPKVAGGLVIHRAMLHDLTGVPQLMDWVADGEADGSPARRPKQRFKMFINYCIFLMFS